METVVNEDQTPEEIEIEVKVVEPVVNAGKSFLPIPLTSGIELIADYLKSEPESFTATVLFHALKNCNGFHQSWSEGNKADALEHLFLAYTFDEKGVSVFSDETARGEVANEILTRRIAEPDNFKLAVLEFWARHSWCNSKSPEASYTERMCSLDKAIAMSESSETSSVAYRLFPNLLYHKACEFMFQELPEKGVVEFTASLQYLESDGRTSMWPYAATSDGRLLALFRHHMILEARLNTGRALSGLRMDVEEPEMAAIAYMQEYVDNAREDSCVYDVALCDLFMANFYLDIIRKNACPGESSLHLLEAKMQDISTRRIPIFDKNLIDHPAFTIAAEVSKFAGTRTHLHERVKQKKKKNGDAN